jgi:FixJ family two-component response regulator
VRIWLRTDERFATAVVTERVRFETQGDPVEDLAAALTERQVQAAEMLATGRHTTVQIARELNITDRTIRNWKKEPAFSLCLEELQTRERERRQRVKEEGEQLLHERIRTVALSAVNVAEGELKRGNGRAAAELLKVVKSLTN